MSDTGKRQNTDDCLISLMFSSILCLVSIIVFVIALVFIAFVL